MKKFLVVPSKPEFSVSEDGCVMFSSTGTIIRNNIKLEESVVVQVCNLLSLGLRIVDIVRITGVSRFNIMAIKSGKSWRHISKDFPSLKIGRKDTLSEKTIFWVKDQLDRGRKKDEILLMSVRLKQDDLERACKIISLLDCND